MNIIHIRSSGRSGSTLLNIILGNCGAIFAGAELFRYSRLWTRNEKIICANGTPVKTSSFWERVKHDVGDLHSITEDEVFAEHVESLMSSILNHSDTEIVCDTSKSRKYFKIIYDEEIFNTCIVHLVRDGRAVTFSQQEKSIWDTAKIAMIWNIANLQTALSHGKKRNYLRVRYEDLILDHENTLNNIEKHISSHFNIPLTRKPYSKANNTYRYAFAGNRMRETFDGEIQYDSRYIKSAGFINWCLTTICCLPALLFFKYPLSRHHCKKEFANCNVLEK